MNSLIKDYENILEGAFSIHYYYNFSKHINIDFYINNIVFYI